MRSRRICGHILALMIVAVAGCARIAATRAPVPEITAAAAPAPILRTVMWSSLFSDVNDPEWRAKMKALHDMNINGASGLLMICRPRFCEYAWPTVAGAQGSSDATYDLMRINQRWLAHVSEVVDYANSFEPPFALQFDFLPHPTLRQGEGMVFKALRMMLSPLSVMEPPAPIVEPRDEMVFSAMGNVQGIKANGTRIFEDVPMGAWAEVSRNWLRATVPIINRARFGAVLFVLERTGNSGCEQWYWNEARAAGLSPSVYVITNAHLGGGAINSPHFSTVKAICSYGQRGAYVSTDGTEGGRNLSAGEVRRIVDSRAAKGDPVVEIYSPYFSADREGGSYASRGRPSAAFIAHKCGAALVEEGR